MDSMLTMEGARVLIIPPANDGLPKNVIKPKVTGPKNPRAVFRTYLSPNQPTIHPMLDGYGAQLTLRTN